MVSLTMPFHRDVRSASGHLRAAVMALFSGASETGTGLHFQNALDVWSPGGRTQGTKPAFQKQNAMKDKKIKECHHSAPGWHGIMNGNVPAIRDVDARGGKLMLHSVLVTRSGLDFTASRMHILRS